MLKNSRLNIQVVCEALLLLTVTLGILAYFAHKALHQEALRSTEQMLEGTVQNVDNILMSVEQSTGNIYYDLVEHLDDPDRMYTYCRELVESNPNIAGCAIVFKPGYYPGHDLFMAYTHRRTATDSRSDLVTSETFANRPYTEQLWYTKPMEGWTGWIDPLKGNDAEDEPLITFCLPFRDKSGERVGVIATDVSVNQLSKIILNAKPSENGYSVLLAHNGSYIIHPDKKKLSDPLVFSHKGRNVDISETEAVEAMLAGERGMKEFRRGDSDLFVFYKPLERVGWEGWSKGAIDWSVGVVCPETDIFGKHTVLIYQVLAIAIIGILLFLLWCNWIIRKQLKPLKRLANAAQHIAEGNYNEMLPSSERLDEIGLLQNRFKEMQHSLQNQVAELKEETLRLRQNGDMLRAAYDKTVENDAMKTSFLHYMTKQIVEPSQDIDKNVTTLCDEYYYLSNEELNGRADIIQQKSQAVLDLTNHLAYFATEETGKEAVND